ncbi:MAG: hypothetical protein QOG10_3960 [Kribbellaceae bacterium]|nr:hypothetical protein [Kribbellaceae bacterium]
MSRYADRAYGHAAAAPTAHRAGTGTAGPSAHARSAGSIGASVRKPSARWAAGPSRARWTLALYPRRPRLPYPRRPRLPALTSRLEVRHMARGHAARDVRDRLDRTARRRRDPGGARSQRGEAEICIGDNRYIGDPRYRFPALRLDRGSRPAGNDREDRGRGPAEVEHRQSDQGIGAAEPEHDSGHQANPWC